MSGGMSDNLMEAPSPVTSSLLPLSQVQAQFAAASPASSEISVSNMLDKYGASVGCSPAPSNSSLLSEQEPLEAGPASRQSPFMSTSASQASPSSSFGIPFTRPDFLNTSIPDSETSSRSSLDGISLSNNMKQRWRRRKNSSDSSGSEGSAMTAGGESMDGEESSSRKNSRNRMLDEQAPLVGKAGAARGRIANIRRESNCTLESEAAHERLVKASQQVSAGFDDIVIDRSPNSLQDQRRRTPSVSSLGDPISIVTNPFMPHSCSPSPTRPPETHKQCYSPSTQQMVRPNIPYSPSPSPTQSPTRQRLLRSLSPIGTRTALKRRYTATCPEDVEAKRNLVRTSTSPLVTDRSFPYPALSTTPTPSQSNEFVQPQLFSLSPNPISAFSLRRPSLLESDVYRRASADSVEADDNKTDDGASIADPDQCDVDTDDISMDVEESAADVSLVSDSQESNDILSTSDEMIDLPTTSNGLPFLDPVTAGDTVTEELISSSSESHHADGSLSAIELAAMEAPLPDDDDDDDL